MVSVNDYAALSAAVYDNAGVGLTSDSGWIRLQNYSDAESGFYAALFENNSSPGSGLALTHQPIYANHHVQTIAY
jgi:hypothetical protein